MPAKAMACQFSMATNEVRAPSIETSTCCPSPVRCRWFRAARMPITPNIGASMSAMGMPILTGGSPGPPLVYIAPLSAWIRTSMALLPSATPAPKPLSEQ
jgi:hypothetical protein